MIGFQMLRGPQVMGWNWFHKNWRFKRQKRYFILLEQNGNIEWVLLITISQFLCQSLKWKTIGGHPLFEISMYNPCMSGIRSQMVPLVSIFNDFLIEISIYNHNVSFQLVHVQINFPVIPNGFTFHSITLSQNLALQKPQ